MFVLQGAQLTHTHTGGDPREGVVPRAAREVYQAVEEAQGGTSYSVKAACFEIYNEQVIDLLNPDAGQLAIRESKAQAHILKSTPYSDHLQ
jgi:hypothetical protein